VLHKNLIGGEWVEGKDVSRNLNPSNTEDVMGEDAQADREQALATIAAAKAVKTSYVLPV
jgi:hypothetical protein